MNPSTSFLPVALLASLLSLAPQDSKPAQQPVNPALVPVTRTEDWVLERQAEVLERAKKTAKAPVIFVGDSITQGWEGDGRAVWEKHFAALGALNLGVSGDRTEHVLWRLEQAPITHLDPKVIVLLIGTNNLGHGTANAEQTLAGVLEVIAVLRKQAPKAVLLVNEIFPRGEHMNPMRGDIAQINQVLRGLADAKTRVLGFCDRWVRADGTLSAQTMPDFLHITAPAYEQWAEALDPELRAVLK
ncbi:MAG: GDSL family lipase [Planctomycetes bacterium]|nr:GDSL family lipase [Planctomycetota bacterium]